MSTVNFEAWLGQTAPIEIAAPIFQSTSTILQFHVISAGREDIDLVGYAAKFVAKFVDSAEVAISEEATIPSPQNGIAKVSLNPSEIPSAGECIGSLNLYSGGNIEGSCTDRILFRFEIQEAIE